MAAMELRDLLNKVGDAAVETIAASEELKKHVEYWLAAAAKLDSAMDGLTKAAESIDSLQAEIKDLTYKRDELKNSFAAAEALIASMKA